jgi:hypothetical protein
MSFTPNRRTHKIPDHMRMQYGLWILKIEDDKRLTTMENNETSDGTCFAAVSKSGCQSQESSRAKPETIGSPTTLCPAV